MDGINIKRAQIQARSFDFLLAAAKACLFPFLTIYFRGLGLNAFQTGIIISVKAWLFMLFAPFWTKCAFRWNKKRFLLMFSVFMLMASNLLLSLVPPVSQEVALRYCQHDRHGNESDIVSMNSSVASFLSTTPSFQSSGQAVTATGLMTNTENTTTITTTTTTTITTTMTTTTTTSEESRRDEGSSGTDTQSDLLSLFPSLDAKSAKVVLEQLRSLLIQDHDYTKEEVDSMTAAEFLEAAKAALESDNINSSNLFPDSRNKRSLVNQHTEDTESLEDAESSKDDDESKEDDDSKEGSKHGVMETLSQWHKKLNGLAKQTFVSVLIVVIIGEIFSAPLSKLADDIWFEFLDCLDVLEKYGREVPWTALGYLLVPVFLTLIVTSSPCLLSYNIHRFMLHFYAFAIFGGLCLIVSFFYPVQSGGRKVKRKNNVIRGLKVLVNDKHSFSLTFTAFLVGLLYAPLANYCFWMVQDKGGSELIMGGAVAASALGDFIMYLSQRWLLHKTGVAGAVIVSLLALAVRMLLYSFMWTAWMVIPGDFLHCLSSTLMWAAVQSYSDFKMNPFVMDRSAQAVLRIIHHGLGFAVGSLLAGYLYEVIGVQYLFLASSIIAMVWCVIFTLLHKCCKKPDKVRYTALLQGEEEDDYSDTYDDDWLEVAMKDEKYH